MRLVVDTNVIVSAYVTPSGLPSKVLLNWERRQFELLISSDILAEYERLLHRPRIIARHRMNDAEISAVIKNFWEAATRIKVTSQLNVIPQDPSDNKFVECAVDGEAEFFVSGDHHLLGLGSYDGIQLLPPMRSSSSSSYRPL